MKSILVPFYDYYDDDASASAVRAACHLAKTFDSYIEGLLVIEGENTGSVDADDPEPHQIAEQIENHFCALVAGEGIAFTPAEDGVNTDRMDPNGSNARNNVGDVWVVATVTPAGASAPTSCSGRWVR